MIGLIVLLLAVVGDIAVMVVAWALCKRAGQLDDAAGMGDAGGES
jgi:hypothetical protein